MLGGLSIVGPTLEPVLQSGIDIWERLARVKHQIYLYEWRGGVAVPGDPNRGDWDEDLDEFAKESNIRSFVTFCRSIAALGRQWATDLGEGGAQSEHPLEPAELLVVAQHEHDSWVRHHVEYGWRFGDHNRDGDTSGRTKAKLHPDIIEWEALSAEDKRKDEENVANTISLMKSLGFTLVDARVAYQRISHRVTAERLGHPWHWVTPRGDPVAARKGDFRITDAVTNASWSIAPDAFAACYRHVTGETYESKGTVQARQLATDSPPVSVVSSEGPERAFPGDWIVTNEEGNDWVVDASFFEKNYQRLDDVGSTI